MVKIITVQDYKHTMEINGNKHTRLTKAKSQEDNIWVKYIITT